MTSQDQFAPPVRSEEPPVRARRAVASTASDRVREVADVAEDICVQVSRVLVGKEDVVRLAVVCLLSEGHLLIEDVPGTGKTSLAKALSRAVDAPVSRIQFTPDLMPSDVTGVSIYNRVTSEFEFRPGPVFASIVVADEINRASPRTQSALLEAMEESQVSVDGTTYPLTRPFLVLATQNPVEMEGTFPLPEAQRDRFLAQTTIGYPDRAAELAMLEDRHTADPLDDVRQVADGPLVQRLADAVAQVHVAAQVRDYLLTLVRGTRELPEVLLGASPRAALHLSRAAKAAAAMEGRDYVVPDDVARLAVPVLAHRLLLAPVGPGRARHTAQELVEQLVERTAVPRGERR
ncbi:ATPase [Serinibacter arcticus]|uniref:ATPase n=1 Tax=Serinibacter arcticus TaxID=1655435 RepID=A0A2U1ZVR4_9MICO|nr:MoxR family ATPase [Serinibacter arcticus]PWD51033.1 ATPase [Serinibacter arcticus]